MADKNIQKPKRINFATVGIPTRLPGVRHYTLANGHGRDFKVSDIEQFQDSLIAHPEYNDARRLAVLATSLEEAGEKGFASRGIGGNGMMGISKERMPIELVGAGPTIGGKQIHWFLEDVPAIHPDNWNHGGIGGLPIKSAKDAHDKFWNSNNVSDATIYLNKGYIRPAEREAAWNNRVATALMLQKLMK